MRAWSVAVFLLVGGLFAACVPASVSRIGSPRPPRKGDCSIEVLPPGQSPSRPWVDIGVILVENCQEYHVGLCKKWVIQKACELGGEIAYLPNPMPPKNETNNINFRVLTAVYATSDSPMSRPATGCVEPPSEPVPPADENEQRCKE